MTYSENKVVQLELLGHCAGYPGLQQYARREEERRGMGAPGCPTRDCAASKFIPYSSRDPPDAQYLPTGSLHALALLHQDSEHTAKTLISLPRTAQFLLTTCSPRSTAKSDQSTVRIYVIIVYHTWC